MFHVKQKRAKFKPGSLLEYPLTEWLALCHAVSTRQLHRRLVKQSEVEDLSVTITLRKLDTVNLNKLEPAEIGSSTTRYICNTQTRGGKWCNVTVDVKSIEPDLVWVSPNGKWHISDPSVGMPHEAAYRNLVQASDDGEVYCTIQMYSDGSFRTDWDVPKYVLESAKKILRAKAEASPKSRSPKSKERATTKITKRRRRHV